MMSMNYFGHFGENKLWILTYCLLSWYSEKKQKKLFCIVVFTHPTISIIYLFWVLFDIKSNILSFSSVFAKYLIL